MHTHKVSESLNIIRTQQKQQQHNDYSQHQQTDWSNSSSSSTQRRGRGRPATSERAFYRQFDDSVPWCLRVVWVCHVCSVSLVGCVVTCALCWLFLAMTHTYVVIHLVYEWITLLSGCMRCFVGFLLLAEKPYAVKI